MDFYKNLSRDNLKCLYKDVEYTEYWLPVVGFEKFYLISSFGRIKSLRNTIIMKQQIVAGKGYLCITLHNHIERKKFKVHRVVAFAFLGSDKTRTLVNHKDFIKTNNFFENLEWCTDKENVHHAQLGGRVPIAKRKIKLERPIRFQKIIDTNTNFVFDSVHHLAEHINIKPKEIRRRLSGERYNETSFKWYKGKFTNIYPKEQENYLKKYKELRNKIYGCSLTY